MSGLFRLQYLSGFQNFLKSEALEGALPLYQNHPQHSPYTLYGESLSGTAFTVPRHLNRYTYMYRLRPSVAHTFKDYNRITTVDEDVENYSLPKWDAFEEDGYTNYLNKFYKGLYKDMVTLWTSPPFTSKLAIPPIQLRWNPIQNIPNDLSIDFIQSLTTMAANGSSATATGGSILYYNCNTSMDPNFDHRNYQPASHLRPKLPNKEGKGRFMINNDAEMLIIPQNGPLLIRTELGDLTVEPLEIAILPKGLKFQVCLLPKNFSALSSETTETEAPESSGPFHKGYVAENFGHFLRLPELGPIGISTGLAHTRHFFSPVANYEDAEGDYQLFVKYQGNLWKGALKYSPLDVVSWFGNYLPCKYDLRLFTCINSVTHDHPDPSIYTVLTSPSDSPGTANIDFVIFPPRWMVQENTFRPPWFHRNCMSEAMGLIKGMYDAKSEGFVPGGLSLHNQFLPHGPDFESWKKAISLDSTVPQRLKGTMAFMLESNKIWNPSHLSFKAKQFDGSTWRQPDYANCWEPIVSQFNPLNKITQCIPFST